MRRALPFRAAGCHPKRYRPFSFASPSFDGFGDDFTVYLIIYFLANDCNVYFAAIAPPSRRFSPTVTAGSPRPMEFLYNRSSTRSVTTFVEEYRMVDYREILRLSSDPENSQRRIELTLHSSRHSIREVQAAAKMSLRLKSGIPSRRPA